VTGGGQMKAKTPSSLPRAISSRCRPSCSTPHWGAPRPTLASWWRMVATWSTRTTGPTCVSRRHRFDFLRIQDGDCGLNTHARFDGKADVNGTSESLVVQVDDCGAPGSTPSGPPDRVQHHHG